MKILSLKPLEKPRADTMELDDLSAPGTLDTMEVRPLAVWLREALQRLFDLDFLRQHLTRLPLHTQWAHSNPLDAQDSIIAAIEKLRPAPTVSVRSEHWRLYQILNLRYLRGLSQVEAADELSLSVRQLRRDQARALLGLATALFPLSRLSISNTAAVLAVSQTGMAKKEASSGNRPSAIAAGTAELLRSEWLLRAALDTIEPLLQQQNLRVQVAVAEGLPPLRADPMIARQLILNALTWMTHACIEVLLKVQADQQDQSVRLQFIRPQPLSVVDETTTSSGSLANVQQLARLLNVQVDVQPGVDRYTQCLTLAFPASQSLCVLMVDDNADAIQLVHRYLRQSDSYYLVSATAPDEALRLAASLVPAVILLDVMLPGRDGWEVLTLLKAHPETARIPVIISSVLQQPDLGHALGAAALLPKPFDAGQLINCLTRVLAHPDPSGQRAIAL